MWSLTIWNLFHFAVGCRNAKIFSSYSLNSHHSLFAYKIFKWERSLREWIISFNHACKFLLLFLRDYSLHFTIYYFPTLKLLLLQTKLIFLSLFKAFKKSLKFQSVYFLWTPTVIKMIKSTWKLNMSLGLAISFSLEMMTKT